MNPPLAEGPGAGEQAPGPDSGGPTAALPGGRRGARQRRGEGEPAAARVHL